MLFNHLTYAAMRCSDQGFVALNQLPSPIEIGMRISVQQMAQYKEGALVQQEPTREAFAATVSHQVADRLRDFRQFIRGVKVDLGSRAPTTSLTDTSADTKENATPTKKQKVVTTPAPTTLTTRVDGVQRSKRIAAVTIVAQDPAINNMEAEQTRN
jgi:hypothetical protein